MNQIALQSFKDLNAIFKRDSDYVFWLRSLDYHKQIYVSSSFEEVWGRKCAELYQDPAAWKDWLLEQENPEWVNKILVGEIEAQLGVERFYYAVRRPDGSVIFIRDQCYFLMNGIDNKVGIAGIAKQLTERRWEAEKAAHVCQNDLEEEDLLKNLQDLFPLRGAQESAEIIPLSERELEVLKGVYEGLTAKQSAELLHLSPRTVEFYLENVKNKLGLNRKADLIRFCVEKGLA